MSKPKQNAEGPALVYRFDGYGALICVEYAGALTSEIHAQIKEAAVAARELGKGRS
jgi:hypothetical protein